MKIRLLALAHFKDGHSRTQIAKSLKVSRTSVNRWVQSFLEEGLEGLQEKPSSGRPACLNPQQREQLSLYIKNRAEDSSGGRLTGADIHAHIVVEFGKYYHPGSIYYLLNHMGFSWITSRSKHPRQSQIIQDDFKKIQTLRSPATWDLRTLMSGFKMKRDSASKIRQLDFGLNVVQGRER
ncbi:helix-turn-helix domain-containing protein [Vibrio sonorensis]|uniref:helix-turn-helix domain-containing protein n=1 Tax=Vibrio sonorensis TaxID=1004316 RepID=UPI000A035696|nr:helix-turn-helix domain-containing protein [Vibrio sonorensis]